jgi:hypothetical protein
MFFLGILYKPISFLTIYKALLAGSLAGVCFYIGVAAGVIDKAYLVWVLLAVTAVHKIGV